MTSISKQSALGSALSGIQRELKSIEKNAQKISDFTNNLENGEDLVKPMIDLKQDIRDVKALRKVVNIVEELDKDVLDILA